MKPEKRKIGYVFQDYALFPHITVKENILYAGKNLEYAEMLGIGHLLDKKVSELSGGEKQRIALARALAGNPDLLLLDEPMSSVVELFRKKLSFEMAEVLRQLDIPVLYVTHSIREALIVGENIAVMNSGRIIQKGDAEEVYEFPNSRFVAEFTGFENVYEGIVVRSGENAVIEWAEGRIHVDFCGYAEGERVYFGIRPKYIMVVREGKELGKNLEGNVFLGKLCRD